MAPDLAKCLTEKISDYVASLPYTVSDVDYFSVPKVVVDGILTDIRTV
jgi:hypothetical protein